MPTIWLIMTIFESILVFHSFVCSIFLLYLISSSKCLHVYCRVYLLMMGFSMLLFASYGLSILEYLLAGQPYSLNETNSTVRSKVWEFIHEFATCLQSVSMLLFSVERATANCYPRLYSSPKFHFLVEASIVVSILFSFAFSMSIHVYQQLIPPTFLMSLSDYLGLIILISTWKSSRRNYRSSAGVASLGRRYQMSEIYSWTSTLLPAVAGASIFKVMAMFPIWVWILLNLNEWQYGIANFLYNNILNAYVVIFPWVLIARNKKLQKQILRKQPRVKPDYGESLKGSVRTLEGKEISMRPSQNEYFDALQESWR